MTDKVQKIRKEIEKIKTAHSSIDLKESNPDVLVVQVCTNLLSFIDSMQKESVSEDFGSMADKYHKEVLIGECQMNDDMAGHCRLSYYLGLKDGAKWQKKRDYIPLSDNINEVARQICNKVLNCEIDYKEDDVVLSDEEECVKAGIRWQMQKESIVSEDLEEASKEWLKPQLDKSYADYGEVKMMELTHFDGYAMLDAIEFGAKWQLNKIRGKYEKNRD